MNILIINTLDKGGGAANVAYALKNEFKRIGHNVKMIVSKKNSDDQDIYEIKKKKFLEKLGQITKKDFIQYFKDKKSFLLSNDVDLVVSQEILNHPFYKEADIIHFHNLHGNYFNLKDLIQISSKKKIVWTLHDMWSITGHCAFSFDCNKWKKECNNCPNLKTYPAYLWDNTKNIFRKKKEIYKKLNFKIVCPSDWLLKNIEKSILRKQELFLIPNGIDEKKFQSTTNRIELRRKKKLPENKQIVVFSAPFWTNDTRKGATFIHELAKQNPKTVFLNLGGNKNTGLKNVISTKYITNQKELVEYLNASDVFLFSSLAENFPLATLEAMSCGIPVVSFDVGGIKEQVIHKKTGYIAKYKNLNQLQEGLDWVFSLSESNYNKICKNAISLVNKKYTLERQAQEYLKLFQ